MGHNETSLEELQRTLITANHILHYNNVVDAYGHISFRHPSDPSTFFMSASLAPALVSSPDDLIQYHISDCSPVDPKAKKGYSERFIHGEIFKKFTEVNSVIHGHPEDVLPYTMNGVPLRPTFHMPGFLDTSTPNYDICKLYKPGDKQDMLVNKEHFGADLANHFISSPASTSFSENQSPDKAVVLMKRHGFTAIGTSIQQAVCRAIYTTVNARVQTNAILLRNAFVGNLIVGQDDSVDDDSVHVGMGEGLSYINEEQVGACEEMVEMSRDRPWGLWVREVEANPLYVNVLAVKFPSGGIRRRVSRPDW